MTTDRTQDYRPIEKLAAGDHISDANGVHRVEHTLDFRDGDGDPAVALTLQPLGYGDPWVAREKRGREMRVATAAEVVAYKALDQRTALASALNGLATRVLDQQLPVNYCNFTIVPDTAEQVEAWAKAGGVEMKQRNGYAVADFKVGEMYVHVQATLPKPAVDDAQAGE